MALSTQDRHEILDLCARYFISTDEKDVDGYMDCWVDDDDISPESVFGNLKGRKPFRDFMDEHVIRGIGVGKRHLLSNTSIRDGEDDRTAYVTSYMVVIDVDNIPNIVGPVSRETAR
jgi:hypothetical protein